MRFVTFLFYHTLPLIAIEHFNNLFKYIIITIISKKANFILCRTIIFFTITLHFIITLRAKKKNSLIKSTCGRVREFPAFKNYLHVRKKNSLIKSTCGRVREFPAFRNYLHVRKKNYLHVRKKTPSLNQLAVGYVNSRHSKTIFTCEKKRSIWVRAFLCELNR